SQLSARLRVNPAVTVMHRTFFKLSKCHKLQFLKRPPEAGCRGPGLTAHSAAKACRAPLCVITDGKLPGCTKMRIPAQKSENKTDTEKKLQVTCDQVTCDQLTCDQLTCDQVNAVQEVPAVMDAAIGNEEIEAPTTRNRESTTCQVRTTETNIMMVKTQSKTGQCCVADELFVTALTSSVSVLFTLCSSAIMSIEAADCWT
ncbi:hypothetical protein GBF38_006406, partial [Nibea albiflora]